MTKAWDSYDAYLFDIDGTLLNCRDAVHYFAFCDALTELAGRPLNLDGVMTQGNTDNGILRDALALANVPPETWRPRLAEMHARMGAFVEARTADFLIEPTPGIVQVLEHLKQRGAILGVATGNLARIGRAKLARAGVLDYFTFGGFSDAYEQRSDVFAGALTLAHQHANEQASVCVVGDTPEDIRAARICSLPVIAVSTGEYTFETLAALAPDLCLHSFADVLRS